MKQAVRVLNILVLLSSTVLIAAIFYRGMGGKELTAIVSIFVSIMDISFIISTICNLLYFKNKSVIFGISVVSLTLIMIAIAMKMLAVSYPLWGLLLWDFYLLYYYGFMVIKQTWKSQGECIKSGEGII